MQNELSGVNTAVEAEISRIQLLKPDDVKGIWRKTFKKEVPAALTRDLLVRTLTWHFQEQAFEGFRGRVIQRKRPES